MVVVSCVCVFIELHITAQFSPVILLWFFYASCIAPPYEESIIVVCAFIECT